MRASEDLVPIEWLSGSVCVDRQHLLPGRIVSGSCTLEFQLIKRTHTEISLGIALQLLLSVGLFFFLSVDAECAHPCPSQRYTPTLTQSKLLNKSHIDSRLHSTHSATLQPHLIVASTKSDSIKRTWHPFRGCLLVSCMLLSTYPWCDCGSIDKLQEEQHAHASDLSLPLATAKHTHAR